MKLLKPIMLILLTAALGAIVVLRSHLDKPITAIEEQNSISAGNSGYSQILQINSKQESDEAVDNTNLKTGENAFSSFVVSDNEYENIVSSRTAALDMGEIEILFDGNPLFCCNDGTWFYSLVEGSETAYNPEVSVSGSQGTLKIAIKEYEITPETIENNEQACFVLYDDNHCTECTLTSTTLPIIRMEVDVPPDDIRKTTVNSTSLYCFDNSKDCNLRATDCFASIRLRGATSQGYTQRSYRLGLKELDGTIFKTSLLGLRKDDDYILNALYNDQEKIRSVFSSNLWYDTVSKDNYFGINLGYEFRYVEVIMNGDYRGLYSLGHPMDGKQADLNTNEYVYKCNKSCTLGTVYNGEAVGSVINFEISDMGNQTKKNMEKNWAPFRNYLKVLSEQNITGIYTVTDIDNQIDVFLFVKLIAGMDNCGKNEMYVSKLFQGKRVMYTVPWDLDLTWGNSYDFYGKCQTGCYAIPADEDGCVVEINGATTLMKAKDNKIIPAIQKKYSTLRSGQWSDDIIFGYLDKYEAKIFDSGAYSRTKARFPNGNYLESESTKLNDFRAYVTARLAYMDDYVENLTF